MNQHYQFWVDYYDELERRGLLSKGVVAQKNRSLCEKQWQESTEPFDTLSHQRDSLCFRVCYPGLLAGLGNRHNSQLGEDDASEIILGITLDPVTGLPYLPGSTVKGVLRSAFLKNTSYIRSLVEGLNEEDVVALEAECFGKQHPHDPRKPEVNNLKALIKAAGGKDVFLDAYPVIPDKEKHILGLENITPHRAEKPELDGLTSPKILNLLKVMPGVIFQFRFQLTDGVIPKSTKLDLFRQLLEDLGAGAKTNVGFGVLEYDSNASKRNDYRYLEQIQPFPISQTVEEGAYVFGTIIGIKEFGAFVQLSSRRTGLIHKSQMLTTRRIEKIKDIENLFYINQRVIVKVLQVDNSNNRISLSYKQVPGQE